MSEVKPSIEQISEDEKLLADKDPFASVANTFGALEPRLENMVNSLNKIQLRKLVMEIATSPLSQRKYVQMVDKQLVEVLSVAQSVIESKMLMMLLYQQQQEQQKEGEKTDGETN